MNTSRSRGPERLGGRDVVHPRGNCWRLRVGCGASLVVLERSDAVVVITGRVVRLLGQPRLEGRAAGRRGRQDDVVLLELKLLLILKLLPGHRELYRSAHNSEN